MTDAYMHSHEHNLTISNEMKQNRLFNKTLKSG